MFEVDGEEELAQVAATDTSADETINSESEVASDIPAEAVADVVVDEVTEESSWDWEDIDFDNIFSGLQDEIDESNKALDKLAESSDPQVSSEVSVLKDSISRMEWQIKKLNNEKIDLQFRNAELEAFWVDGLQPREMALIRALSKSKDDDAAKDKAIKQLKDYLFDLTWEDIDATRTSTDIDLLTQAELYNNAINPNLKASTQEDEGIAL